MTELPPLPEPDDLYFDTYDGATVRELYEAMRAYAAAAVAAEREGQSKDAARWRWLTNLKCNSLTLDRDGDHACNYMTASDWIDDNPELYAHDNPAEVERMRATNTIWSLQVYPDTPIGSVTWNASTADAAIDAAMSSA